MLPLLKKVIEDGVVDRSTVVKINEQYPSIETEELALYTTIASVANVTELIVNIKSYMLDLSNDTVLRGIDKLSSLEKSINSVLKSRKFNEELIAKILNVEVLVVYDKGRAELNGNPIVSLSDVPLSIVLTSNVDEVEELVVERDQELLFKSLSIDTDDDLNSLLSRLNMNTFRDFVVHKEQIGRTISKRIEELSTKVIRKQPIGVSETEFLRQFYNNYKTIASIVNVVLYLLTVDKGLDG